MVLVSFLGPAIETGTLPSGRSSLPVTFTPMCPVLALYVPTGGATIVCDSAGVTPAMFGQVTWTSTRR